MIGMMSQNAGWPNVTVFRELIAPTPERIDAALESARSHLHGHINIRTSGVQFGLSPHAPYSVHPELLAAIVAMSAAEKIPLAMHLAESQAELELLRHGSGPLRMFLEEIGAWTPGVIPPGARPMDYLQRLAAAQRALVIHGNYLEDDEIAFLGRHAATMAAVYCPRSHDWFAHAPYPIEKMLAAGVTLALGTDGRGSSPDLSLWAEMQFVAEHYPAVGLDRILQMGTLSGAKALGREEALGTLEPGKQASFTFIRLPDHEAVDPHELLLQGSTLFQKLT
jgi:cytosine/adenosine deaminase-related metal-dependent hydrolase